MEFVPSQKEESVLPVVLLVEDSEDDAFFFRRAFNKASIEFSLLRAGNGKVAIEMIEAGMKSGKSPRLIFLDLKMPVMSGFEVLEWLQEVALQTKVIVLSGSNEQTDRARALQLGAIDYVVKPITAEYLRQVVSKLGQAAGELVEPRMGA